MKPKVICHAMASVNGHIQSERWIAPANGTTKNDLMKTYSEISQTLYTDAWTIGKHAVREIFHDTTSIFRIEENNTEKDRPVCKTI